MTPRAGGIPCSCCIVSVMTLDERVIIWFDIDNTLYSASTKIAQAMGERIHGKVTYES